MCQEMAAFLERLSEVELSIFAVYAIMVMAFLTAHLLADLLADTDADKKVDTTDNREV